MWWPKVALYFSNCIPPTITSREGDFSFVTVSFLFLWPGSLLRKIMVAPQSENSSNESRYIAGIKVKSQGLILSWVVFFLHHRFFSRVSNGLKSLTISVFQFSKGKNI